MLLDATFRSDEHFTQAQFQRWVEAQREAVLGRYELLNGFIVMSPPATWRHSGVAVDIGFAVAAHVKAHNLGFCFESSVGVELRSGDTVQPDFTFISHARMAQFPAALSAKFLRVTPSLVVEVLSRSTAKRDRTEKKSIYEENRVDEYWIVDVKQREVAVFSLQQGRYNAGSSIKRGEVQSLVLPDLYLRVETIFTSI